MGGEVMFDFGDGVFAEVEDAGGEGGVGVAGGEDLVDVFGGASAAGGDDGDADGVGDGCGHFEVVAGGGAVGVHDVEDDFACAEGFGLFDPGHDVEAGVEAAAVDEDVPLFGAVDVDSVGVEAEDGGVGAEALGDFADELGSSDGGGIDGDFFGAGLDESDGVIEGSDPPADAEGHEDLLADTADEVGHDVAAFVAGGDVVEDEFVGAVGLVSACLLDGVAGVDVVEELDAFDHPAAVYVEAGDDPLGKHARRRG